MIETKVSVNVMKDFLVLLAKEVFVPVKIPLLEYVVDMENVCL